jgi:hypothetical protein
MPDDLTCLREKPISDVVGDLERLMSHSNRAFLLGAGCSRIAGLPLTMELTDKVMGDASLGSSTGAILGWLKDQFARSTTATIEDYLSELVDLTAVLERRHERGSSNVTMALGDCTVTLVDLQAALQDIKRTIALFMDPQHINISTHRDFIRAVHASLTAGKLRISKHVDYFVLNYDTLIEDALALERIRYVDGFCGGTTGWWDPSCFESEGADARVFKVHGSIDWCLLEGETLPRRVRRSLDHPAADKKKVLIWPASTKYRETQNDPYAQIIELMRGSLRPTNGTEVVLTVCGYRFRDSHMNIEIDHALRESEKRLTLLVFTGDDAPSDQLAKWADDPAIQDQVRIHAKRGFFHGGTRCITSTELPWWKFEVLGRILGGER